MGHSVAKSVKTALLLLILFLILTYNINSQWSIQHYDTTYTLSDINFINQNTGFAVGARYRNYTFYGVILKTSNAGNQWNVVLADSNAELNGCGFLNSTTGFAVGGTWSENPKMFKTTNGGNNWFDVQPDSIAAFINSIVFFGQTAFATTMSGVFKSLNGGSNWFRVLGNFSQFACSYFLNENTGWSFYDYGWAYKTTNGGMNWVTSYLGYRYPHSVQFFNSNTGYFICDTSEQYYYHNQILKTTNGGSNWTFLNTGLNNHQWSMHFVNENTGYVCGSGGEVIKTTDAGSSWNISWTGLSFGLLDITFLDAYTGYACGSSSIIIKTTSGGFIGINPISNNIPVEFQLYQNYPNPFNPVTNIKFSIPKAGNVNITIYDIIGKEVQTIFNEALSPGTYTVKWNANKYSSGIYFYKLIANDFVSVRKMSYLK